MSQASDPTEQVFQLSPKIQILPIVHGSGNMAQVVREAMISRPVDCLAVPLLSSVEGVVESAIQELPRISVVVVPEDEPKEGASPTCSYIPIDPCQPVIMGLRVAKTEQVPCAYIDKEVVQYTSTPWVAPDPYVLQTLRWESLATVALPFLPCPEADSPRWERIAWMAFRLHELELDYQRILFLCPLVDWPWVRQAYAQRSPISVSQPALRVPKVWDVELDSLYFVLGELPYVTQLYEDRRCEARSDKHLSIDGLKELLLESRRRWMLGRPATSIQEANWVTPQLLQRYFQYVRNLTLMNHRLTPDLYTLVRAAQQMAGDEFALVLLEVAKTYHYQEEVPSWKSQPAVSIGLGELQDPEGTVLRAMNRLEGPPLEWRKLTLRPKPPVPQKRSWAYRWNPYQQCSWPPEDQRIESFAAHVRQQSRNLIGADIAKVETFQTSLMDGLDLRETLRKWTTSNKRTAWDLQVKVIPPARGTIEAIVFFFEVPADPDKFSWRTTWYAEHQEESTLSFYATPFSTNMIGPGIGEACYGGSLFLFPPRIIPDIWENPAFNFTTTLEERLLAGACGHSQETHVAVVSPVPLKGAWRRIAHRYGRKLVPIPLQRFSSQTVSRLRRFHVLNGHDIRSFAARFIRE